MRVHTRPTPLELEQPGFDILTGEIWRPDEDGVDEIGALRQMYDDAMDPALTVQLLVAERVTEPP